MKPRITYANVAATLALFFALGSTALAMRHYLITSTKQIKPSVLSHMFNKLFVGLAPLLAMAAFAVMPVAGQAVTQHWYKNNVISPQGEAVPFVMFGGEVNLGQTGPLGEVNCKTVAGGTIENPVGGGFGIGSMSALAFYECKAPQCEAQIKETTGLEGRMWPETKNMPASINGHKERRFVPYFMQLEESTVMGVSSIRLKIGRKWVAFETPSPEKMIRVAEGCEIAASETVTAMAEFEGELQPEIGAAKKGNLNGTSAAKPSSVRFEGASTNELHGMLGNAVYFGSLKYLGYNEQEIITVKP